MKVIGVGFGRTGTMSLKVALEELGAGPCLHTLKAARDSGPTAADDDGERDSPWERVASGEQIDWRAAFEGWGSTVDWLGVRFYPELLQAWPQAKVILSVRDPQAWYESAHASLDATRNASASQLSSHATGPALMAFWDELFDGRFADREYALTVFERHRAQVLDDVPAEQLLVYDVREGWEPLCQFLDVPIPSAPFPHLDGAEEWAPDGAGGSGGTEQAAGPDAQATDRSAPAAGADARLRARAGLGGQAGPRTHGGLKAEAGFAEPRAEALPRLAGIGTAEPEVTLDQHQMLELLGLTDDEFAQRIFARCGVQRRHMHLTAELLGKTLQARTQEVEDYLMDVAVESVEKLRVDPQEIGTVVTATLYSLGCPPLASRLIEHFEMDPSTDKYHLVGVGCASAVPLIRLAEGALRCEPQKSCLIVGAESMSGLLVGASKEDERSKTVGSAIFGDGCGAMLLDAASEGAGPRILASQVHQVPDSLGAVCMQLAPQDSYLHLIRELPDVAGEQVGGLVERFLAACGMTGHMIDHWMIHPGGRRIIECAQQALGLPDEEVAISYQTLAERGNVGTPSIFYVIEQTILQRRPRPGEHGLAVTIGPGVSVGLMLLRW